MLNTTTFSSGCSGPGGGGCGIAAFRPVRSVGLMVMKITSKTRRMSINGVMLMSARGSILRRFFFMRLLRVACRDLQTPHGAYLFQGRRPDLCDNFEFGQAGLEDTGSYGRDPGAVLR